MELKVRRLHPEAKLPAYMTDGAAGMDLCIHLEENKILQPGERFLAPTGIAIELPARHEGQVRPRSGLAVKQGLTVLNAPGTIDEDYRGEIRVPLINHGKEPVVLEPGMRIAQLVIAPVTRVSLQEVETLSDSTRGTGGFGHTGK